VIKKVKQNLGSTVLHGSDHTNVPNQKLHRLEEVRTSTLHETDTLSV
jgi:hypothetical protein